MVLEVVPGLLFPQATPRHHLSVVWLGLHLRWGLAPTVDSVDSHMPAPGLCRDPAETAITIRFTGRCIFSTVIISVPPTRNVKK